MLTLLLGTFSERFKIDPTVLLAETGDPSNLMRHAIGAQDGEITFIFDTMDGPKAGGTELMDIGIFPDSSGAMIVTSQLYTADVRDLINGNTTDQIGKGIYAKYRSFGDVKLSALGDPELDGKYGIFFYNKGADGKYTVKGVGKEMQGYAIDGDKSIVYKDGNLLLVDTTDLLDALRENAIASLSSVALTTETIGGGAKMARTATIEIGDEQKKVWAYIAKDGDDKPTIFYLDYESLKPLAMQSFKGTYATPSVDRKDMILVGRTVEDQVEKFVAKRHDLPGFTADAIAA